MMALKYVQLVEVPNQKYSTAERTAMAIFLDSVRVNNVIRHGKQ